MKKIIHTTIVIFVLFQLSCSHTKDKELRVMTWNIWHGGLHGNKSEGFKKDTANTDNVLKVINRERPDILFIQETYCCGMDIVKQAGYEFSWRGSSNLSIHSKYPIIDTIDIYKSFNSHAVVIDVKGQNILFVNLWLHYLPNYFQDIKTLSPDSLILGEGVSRFKEIQAILSAVDSLNETLKLPVIIGGDFNSGSHLDWVEATKDVHYNKVVECPVSKWMIDHHYIDSFREANPDLTKTLDGTWGFLSNDIISDKIDYIYYKCENIKTKTSIIIKDDPKDGFFNSDHRAILSVFEL